MTIQIRKNKKDASISKLRQIPTGGRKKLAHSGPMEMDSEKDGATSPCPREVEFDASIDNLCTMFGRMSLETSIPTKNEQVCEEMRVVFSYLQNIC